MDDDIHFLASKLSRISRSRDGKAAVSPIFWHEFVQITNSNNTTAAANLIKSS
jgi:hypothetical protein